MKIKIKNKKKFFIRILQILVAFLIIFVTIKAIKIATIERGYKAFGGEYFIPFLAIIIIAMLEDKL